MEIINWVKEEEKGRFDQPNLVAYALIEAMANHSDKPVDEVFTPFEPQALQVEFKVNGVEVSFKGVMEAIQQGVKEIEEDVKKTIIKDAAQGLIDQLQSVINMRNDWYQ